MGISIIEAIAIDGRRYVHKARSAFFMGWNESIGRDGGGRFFDGGRKYGVLWLFC
jgi:hypothetical protein